MYRSLRRICRRFNIAFLYETSVGIKCTIPIVRSGNFKYFISGAPAAIRTEDMRLFFDGLNDERTLLNTPIDSSPHYQLMRALIENKDISDSEYVCRVANGSLDFRQEQRVDQNYLTMLKNRFETMRESIQADDYEPIMVVRVENCYNIADGKHRAALCASLNLTPRCVDVSPIIYDSFFWWAHERMQKNPETYNKHIQLFKSLMAERP